MRVVDALIPPSHRARPDLRARARLAIVMVALSAVACAVFVPINVHQANPSVAILFGTGALASLAFLGCFRAFDSVAIPSHGIATLISTLLVFTCLEYGKADVGTLIYFAVVPLALLFMAGTRAGVVWLVVGILVSAAVVVADARELLPPGSAKNNLISDFANVVVVALLVFGFAFLFHLMKEDAVRTAEAASRAKGEFIATMTHELRTPLNGVIGMADVLVDNSDDDGQRDIARTIRRSGEALLEIIDEILSIERFEAGAVKLSDEEVDPRGLVGFVRDMMAARAAEKKLHLDLVVDTEVPRRVVGDPGALRQVVLNLVGNAIKFTHQGGVTVRVSCTDHALRFAVEDTGIGIAPELRARLFSPFTQGDSSTARRYGGTGLGLSICRRFVTEMHGRIDFISEPGRGSTFWFEVPLRLPSTTSSPSTPPRAADAEARGARGRALVVEDNPVNQRVTMHMLRARGYACEVASDGDAALQALAGDRFDIVFMDCQLPGIDGFETTRRLRARGERTPVVAMTAGAQPGDRQACLDAGMDDYLTKPVTTDELERVLSRFSTRPAGSDP